MLHTTLSELWLIAPRAWSVSVQLEWDWMLLRPVALPRGLHELQKAAFEVPQRPEAKTDLCSHCLMKSELGSSEAVRSWCRRRLLQDV